MPIPLLTPEAVKEGSSRQRMEQAARVRDLSDEENRLVNSVNELREEEKLEKKRIAEEGEVNQATFATRKTVLVREVEALESRKAEALKPARFIEEEARTVLAANQAQSQKLTERAEELEKSEAMAVRGHELIQEKAQELIDRASSLDAREVGIKATEEALGQSTQSLAEKWALHAIAQADHNDRDAALTIRETAVSAATIANSTRAEELEKFKASLDERARGITDGYATLEAARKEILG